MENNIKPQFIEMMALSHRTQEAPQYDSKLVMYFFGTIKELKKLFNL